LLLHHAYETAQQMILTSSQLQLLHHTKTLKVVLKLYISSGVWLALPVHHRPLFCTNCTHLTTYGITVLCRCTSTM